MSHTFKDRKDIVSLGDPLSLKLSSFNPSEKKQVAEDKLLTEKMKREFANIQVLSLNYTFIRAKK